MRLNNSSNSAAGLPDNISPIHFTDEDSHQTTSQPNNKSGDSTIVIEQNTGIAKEADSNASIVLGEIAETSKTEPARKQISSRYGIVLGLFLPVVLLGSSSYFYWRTYEASHQNIVAAENLYQRGCQPSEWTNASAVASANENFGYAKELLQKVPNFPGLGYENVQNNLIKIAQCSQQLQLVSNTINYQLSMTQQVQNLVSDVAKFSDQLSPHFGYQAYSAELQRLLNNLQAFEQSSDFAYVKGQDSLAPLQRSLAALRRSHDDLVFAYRVWSYCQAENACFRSTGTSEEFLPTSSDPIPEVAAVLINSYGMTSEQPMGWFILPRNGIALNKALNTVWSFAEQDLQEAQQAINEEVAYLQGNPQ
ncbi:hypothetical protein H6G89_33820 [Oscillatoria sp. FACHB-1407]|uniref:hypothetical protein n=1 Tax=Oscillatoria sp. FACHB-1407 TaxID=2692847 RepID=UPI0016822A46|nr:hypothetical protein [Oscillatoria sp. FACHB-1407]MBD2465965.1 hypothetical protein [Oscillatoria sp. FACHB-1407]